MIRYATNDDLQLIDYLGSSIHSNFNLYYDIKLNMSYDYVKVILEDDKGFVYIENHDEFIDIIAIATNKKYLRSGIATRLLQYVKNYYNLPLMVEVREDNIPAINLYEKLGFTKINIRKKYYDHKVNALIMRWD